PDILKRFARPQAPNLIAFSVLRKNDRFDPLFYIGSKGTEFFNTKRARLRLSDIVEPTRTSISKSKKNTALYRYLEVNGVDPRTGKIKEVKEYEASKLPSRAKYVV